jgi:hypothetical protein
MESGFRLRRPSSEISWAWEGLKALMNPLDDDGEEIGARFMKVPFLWYKGEPEAAVQWHYAPRK